ncbi:MAG: DUF512 domain-containing protein [Clostridia bacterium]|nr:DUF512 domain-containing protein [Clostridia bacterium]
MVKITDVEKKSPAAKKRIKPGDVLISINGNEINDVLDYRFYLADEKITLLVERNGRTKRKKIKKGEYDDVGLVFETPLMDKKHSCKNKCIFCFIDQNPEGMRESIYFKDDDSRLSFIHGNYVTLTNMTDADVERIIKMRMSPINISVHTTDPELRVAMMKNKRSGEVLRYLRDFAEAGLTMAGQIVLCRGVNDGEHLRKTLSDLSELYPSMSSVAVVPAGLTKHREGLYPLADFTEEEAGAVIDMIDGVGEKNLLRFGTRVVFAADELYLKAGRELPPEDYYEDYPQLDNGVGMLRLFAEEESTAIDELAELSLKESEKKTVTLVTGAAAEGTISDMADRLSQLFPNTKIRVKKIINRYFGETVTVSGLLTGRDILEQLSGEDVGDEVFIPHNCLRYPEEDFLCGMTRQELEESLGVPVRISSPDVYENIRCILGIGD